MPALDKPPAFGLHFYISEKDERLIQYFFMFFIYRLMRQFNSNYAQRVNIFSLGMLEFCSSLEKPSGSS